MQNSKKTKRLVFAVSETGPDAAAGDLFTAMELGQALQARGGWEVEYRPTGDGWYDLAGVDVLVAMLESYVLPEVRNAAAGLITVAWARNWFERWAQMPWMAGFDVVLASSQHSARYLTDQLGRMVGVLRIATNPQRFDTGQRINPTRWDYVFTGSYWQSERDIVAALTALPQQWRGAIFGKNWEQLPALAHLNQGFVPYSEIPQIYAQSTLVVDDANHVTKDWAAANSRVFDALAAGCLVITNSQSVSDEVFAGLLPTYQSPEHLSALLDDFLKNTSKRLDLLNKLQNKILKEHTYIKRALEFDLYISRAKPQKDNPYLGTVDQQLSKQAEKSTPWVSFVVPLYNHLEQTQEMLASLQSSLPTELRYEVIFVDDGSNDGTREWLKGLDAPNIKTHLNEKNQGYAATNNNGVRLAEGELLCLLNNDLLFTPGWFEPMLTALLAEGANNGLVGNIQYRVIDGELDHAGVFINPKGQFDHIRDLPEISTVSWIPMPIVTGACMLLRKMDYEAVGGLDEAFINGCEDIDLCLKIGEKGKQVVLASQSSIQHHVSLSRSRQSLQNLRNARLLIQRWRSTIEKSLAQQWLHLIKQGEQTYHPHLDGDFLPLAKKVPQSLARRMAQSQLLHEEHILQQQLEGPPSQADIQAAVEFSGINQRIPTGGFFMNTDEPVYIHIKNLKSINAFYVCGVFLHNIKLAGLEIKMQVNNLQEKTFSLSEVSNFNFGIISPIFLDKPVNIIKIQLYASSDSINPAYLKSSVKITHFNIEEWDIIP